MTTPKERFTVACKMVKEINDENALDDEFGKLYGLYKQSTIGDCNIEKPNILQIKECKKWNYWKKCKGLSKENAMNQYADYVVDLIDKYDMKCNKKVNNKNK